MNVYEMEGFLRGKCMPRDILVNESTAAYLVRKLNEATVVKAERDALAANCGLYRESISKARRLINIDEMGDADDVLAKAERDLPATSAALAAIEARGVEKLIKLKVEQLANMHPDTHAFGSTAMSLRAQINELQAFSAKLREAK